MPFPGHRTQAEVIEHENRTTQIPWCPIEHRQHYRELRRKHVPASEARPMIEELIARTGE
jgi:hypothetical protein